MKLFKYLRATAVALACVNFIVPLRIMQAATLNRPTDLSVRKDVVQLSLSGKGRLSGQVVDQQGQPLTKRIVSIFAAQKPESAAKPLAETTTDGKGNFQIDGMKAGAYIVVADESVVVCRCWTERTAPPVANKEVLLVASGEAQRGQHPIGELLFSNPIILTLIIIAAIAIPIAIHNSQNNGS